MLPPCISRQNRCPAVILPHIPDFITQKLSSATRYTPNISTFFPHLFDPAFVFWYDEAFRQSSTKCDNRDHHWSRSKKRGNNSNCFEKWRDERTNRNSKIGIERSNTNSDQSASGKVTGQFGRIGLQKQRRYGPCVDRRGFLQMVSSHQSGLGNR